MICLKKSKKWLILYIPLLTEIKYTSKTHSLKKLKLNFFQVHNQRQCRKSDRGLWKIQLLYFGACVFLASFTYKFLEIKQTMHERPAARTYIFQGSSKIKLLYRLRNISISSIVCLTVVYSKWMLITSHTIYSIFATIYCKIKQCICI